MGFSLTIADGKEQGREYTFNQPEISIGRTAENDLVLIEAGVSRRHVRIREEAGQFFVEDLGSANGTKVNGNPITDDEVRDGDTIQVGPVVFAFTGMAAAGGESTRIFDAGEVERKAQATRKARDNAVAGPGATAQRRAVTSVAPALGRGNSGRRPAANAPAPRPAATKSLAKRGSSAPAPPVQKSASERARQRRQASTPLARIKLWWDDAPKKQRMIASGGAGVAALLLVFLVVKIATRSGHVLIDVGDESNRTFSIGPEPLNDSFGLGASSLTHITRDKAQFEFLFSVTAKKAIATLHFETAGVNKPELVDVEVNTIHVGFVEPSFGDQLKDQEIAIPPKYLKPNRNNRVVFDHLKNPPGREPWYLTHVWVEVQQLPEDTPDNLKRRAHNDIEVGDRAWDGRLVGADNTYKAWKAYKEAALYLEALDEHVPDLDLVRQKIRDASRELDRICAAQMLKGVSAETQGHDAEAIKIYKGALLYFPDHDHHCYADLHKKLDNLE